MSATVQFDKNYVSDLQYITHGESLSALETYIDHVSAYSTAAITRLSVTAAKAATIAEKSGDYDSISIQAKLLVRDLDTNKLWGIMIPAPIAFMFEEVQGEGFRVKQSIGEQITSYYAAYAGLNLQFDSGWMIGGR